MATKKTNPSAAIRSSLIAGARAAAPKYTGTKGLNINIGGLLGMAQKEAAKTAQLKQQLESQLGYMPDVTKVAENEAPILQDYFQTGKNQIADLHNELQYADPEQKREIMQQISQIENSAKAANGYLTKKAELATEFRDNLDNISESMPHDKLEKIQAVLMGNDYKIEFSDYSGKPVYVLPDGSKLAHEDLDDFYYKDSKTALAVNDYADAYLERGRSGKPLTPADINILKTKLGQSIDNEGSINSLITDKLIEGMNFGQAVEGLGPNATFQEKKSAVIDYISGQLEEVHKQGQNEYDKKQGDGGETKEITTFGPSTGSFPGRGAKELWLWSDKDSGYEQYIDGRGTGVIIKTASEANKYSNDYTFK